MDFAPDVTVNGDGSPSSTPRRGDPCFMYVFNNIRDDTRSSFIFVLLLVCRLRRWHNGPHRHGFFLCRSPSSKAVHCFLMKLRRDCCA